jgi:hypothetical protein
MNAQLQIGRWPPRHKRRKSQLAGWENEMPDKRTAEKARKDKRAGKAEIDKIRHGKHGTRSPEQAIAIGIQGQTRRGSPSLAPQRQGQGAHAQKCRIRL